MRQVRKHKSTLKLAVVTLGSLLGCGRVSSTPKQTTVGVVVTASDRVHSPDESTSLADSANVLRAPVALVLSARTTGGKVETKILDFSNTEAEFQLPSGPVEMRAMYLMGEMDASAVVAARPGSTADSGLLPGLGGQAKDSLSADVPPLSGLALAEKIKRLQVAACAAPQRVRYLYARANSLSTVNENTSNIQLSLPDLSRLQFVPVVFQTKGVGGTGSEFSAHDPYVGVTLPSACPNTSLSKTTVSNSGVAALRLPVGFDFSSAVAITPSSAAAANASPHVFLVPEISQTSLKENFFSMSLAAAGTTSPDGGSEVVLTKSLASEFGDEFVAGLVGGVEPAKICEGTAVLGIKGTAKCSQPPGCTTDGSVGCVANGAFKAVDSNLLVPANIKNGVTIAGQVGSYPSAGSPLVGASGTDLPSLSGSVAAGNYQFWKSDGTRVTGAILETISAAPSASNQTFSAGLYRGLNVAGDVNLSPNKIVAGEQIFEVTGTASARPSDCSGNGTVGCVTTSSFKSADLTNLSSGNVKSGVNIAGVSGILIAAPANCSMDGSTGCVANASFKAVDMTLLIPANLKNGATIAGQVGNYPSAINPLPGATGTADLVSLASTTAAGAYEFWDSSGARYSGSISNAGTITPTTSSQIFSTSLYRTFSVAGDPNLVPAKIITGSSIFGVTGTVAGAPGSCSTDGATGCVAVAAYPAASTTGLASKVLSGQFVAGVGGNVVLPSAAVVRSSASFGSASGTTGTLSDCTTDGSTNCVIPSSGPMKAADTTEFSGWDIRKKRTSTGSVLTFAGLTGQAKSHCRNLARLGYFDNQTSPGATGLDFFDTIGDFNGGIMGLPGNLPAWTILVNSTNVNAPNDFKCGGIYATGSVSTGNTGADATLAHDAEGNWQDLTPGVVPGGANSSNTANGCNAIDKHCVFKELMSGLMVTEVSASSFTWGNAINYCNTLGEAGNAYASSPIPIIGSATFTDWRLPTQKELLALSNAGMRGLNQTSTLIGFFGNIDASALWTSTTDASTNSYGIASDVGSGLAAGYSKSSAFKAICVR